MGYSGVSVVLLHSVLHWSSSLADVNLAAFTGKSVNYAALFSRSTASFVLISADLGVVSDMKTARRLVVVSSGVAVRTDL